MLCVACIIGPVALPRLLNILAHKSLLAVYGEGKHAVRPANVQQAAADTRRGFGRMVVK